MSRLQRLGWFGLPWDFMGVNGTTLKTKELSTAHYRGADFNDPFSRGARQAERAPEEERARDIKSGVGTGMLPPRAGLLPAGKKHQAHRT